MRVAPNILRRWLLSSTAISARLSLGITFLFLATVAIITTFSFPTLRDDLSSIMLSQQDTLVTRVADELDLHLQAIQKSLVDASRLLTEEDVSSPDTAQSFLDRNIGLQALFDRSIFLFSASGEIMAERPYLTAQVGEDYSWRGYIRDTVTSRAPVISVPFVTSKPDQSVVIMFTAPVFSKDGRLIAILTGCLGLSERRMLSEISRTVIGKTGYLYIATAGGMLVMHPDKSLLTRPALGAERSAFRQVAFDGRPWSGEATDANGRKLLISYRRLSSTGWVLAGVYPLNEAVSPFNQLGHQFIFVIAAVCVITLVGVWLYTHHLLRNLGITVAGLESANALLEIMRGQADYQLRTRSRFFHEASHDFKQRLHALQVLVHAARVPSPAMPHILSKLSYSVEELQVYVRDFLEFAKLSTIKSTPKLAEVELQSLFQTLELEFED